MFNYIIKVMYEYIKNVIYEYVINVVCIYVINIISLCCCDIFCQIFLGATKSHSYNFYYRPSHLN